MLIVGAASFVRALRQAGSIEPGFNPAGVELTSLDLSLGGYSTASGGVFLRELAERVRQLPGVQQATLESTGEPIGDGIRGAIVAAPGAAQLAGPATLMANWNAVDPGYFATLDIPFLAGRDFTAADAGGLAGRHPGRGCRAPTVSGIERTGCAGAVDLPAARRHG